MSLSIASTGAASALQTLSVHAHGHGHKKGLESLTGSVDSTDPTSGTAAPAGSTQSLFSSLMSSAEQIIGAQAAKASPPTTVVAAQPNPVTSALGGAATSLLGTLGTALKVFA